MNKSSVSKAQTTCKACKIETSHGLFEKPENLKATKELLGEVGFTADSTFMELIKEKIADLCALCGEIEIFKLALMSVIVDKTDRETRELIRQLLNALTGLVEESVWFECKRAIHSEMVRSKLSGRAPWRLFMRLCNLRGQPQHVGSAEAGFIAALRKQGYSVRDLAFIFDRSKETIHRRIGEEAFR